MARTGAAEAAAVNFGRSGGFGTASRSRASFSIESVPWVEMRRLVDERQTAMTWIWPKHAGVSGPGPVPTTSVRLNGMARTNANPLQIASGSTSTAQRCTLLWRNFKVCKAGSQAASRRCSAGRDADSTSI